MVYLVDFLLLEPIQASDRQNKMVFVLDSSNPEQAQGIRLQSILDVVSQVRAAKVCV